MIIHGAFTRTEQTLHTIRSRYNMMSAAISRCFFPNDCVDIALNFSCIVSGLLTHNNIRSQEKLHSAPLRRSRDVLRISLNLDNCIFKIEIEMVFSLVSIIVWVNVRKFFGGIGAQASK